MGNHLIILTKLDNRKVLLNIETVKYVESIPDTLVLFINGESVIVKESLDEITEKIVEFKAKVLNSKH